AHPIRAFAPLRSAQDPAWEKCGAYFLSPTLPLPHSSPPLASPRPPRGPPMKPLVLPAEPRRILIIKPSAIGDIVHALPVLNLVRRRWPAARLSWLVTPACADLLVGHPQLDEVILFERRKFGHGWRSPRALWDLMGFMDSI